MLPVVDRSGGICKVVCGEIWRVNLAVPPGDTHGGEADALVVQDAAYGRGSPMVLVVPLSEEPSSIGFPGTVAIDQVSEMNGAPTAMVFQLRALDRGRFVQRLGEVSEAALNEVLAEIDRLTGRTPRPLD